MNNDPLAATQRELDAIDVLVSRSLNDELLVVDGADAPPIAVTLTEELEDDGIGRVARQCRSWYVYLVLLFPDNVELQSTQFSLLCHVGRL
jgi:hypothetical protein